MCNATTIAREQLESIAKLANADNWNARRVWRHVPAPAHEWHAVTEEGDVPIVAIACEGTRCVLMCDNTADANAWCVVTRVELAHEVASYGAELVDAQTGARVQVAGRYSAYMLALNHPAYGPADPGVVAEDAPASLGWTRKPVILTICDSEWRERAYVVAQEATFADWKTHQFCAIESADEEATVCVRREGCVFFDFFADQWQFAPLASLLAKYSDTLGGVRVCTAS